ncbi:hypothetical protein Y032_0939g3132 [Ancylostoma ceylanicum]|uniref:Uncharacterized protein n=1 Tax=Ancylostoma ceylanicum TaxID=53326 RepID=A0A016W8B5_9BILA|nr:hypothetical protein Y032_0939g3132 [Ancylostoma ceylanicum]
MVSTNYQEEREQASTPGNVLRRSKWLVCEWIARTAETCHSQFALPTPGITPYTKNYYIDGYEASEA